MLGWAAQALPAPTIQPKYEGFAGESVAVMVWADRGMRMDWPKMPIDIASAIQKLLQETDARQFKGTTWPWPAESVARFQRDHPDIESQPITEAAARISNITRLIYIEIEDFGTRTDYNIELYRGHITGTVKVIEISNGVGTLAFEEQDISSLFPRRSPREGMPNVKEWNVYVGTLGSFAQEITRRFVPYSAED